jgi:hypothetical protein
VGCGSSFGPGLRRWEGQRPVLGTLGKWCQAQLWKAAFGKDWGRGGHRAARHLFLWRHTGWKSRIRSRAPSWGALLTN